VAASTRLDIVYVGTLPPHPGGSATVGGQLVVGLAQRGHRVRTVAPITAAALQSGDEFAQTHTAVAVCRFVVPHFESSPDHPPPDSYRESEGQQISAALKRLIADQRPDIIVIGRETFAWHVPDLAARYDLPTILLVHGGTTAGMTRGTLSDAQAQRLREQIGRANAIVLVARHLAELFQAWGFRHLYAVQNGVDLHQFIPQPKNRALQRAHAIDDADIVIAHVSNMKSLKRPLDVVASAELALRQDPRLLYLIVGDGPLRQAAETACRQKDIANRFRFVGWVPHEQVPDYLNLADVVVMPSESEALALVYLETMACGRVLLASDVPGAREVVVDGENGLLFRKGDVAELTFRTLSAASDPAGRAAIGGKARQMVRAHDLSAVVDAYASIIQDVIQERAHSFRAQHDQAGS